MPRCKTLQAAEKQALEGKNESQDSQAIFDRYVAEYGIGVLASATIVDHLATHIESQQTPPRFTPNASF
ncbi:ubiD family decarboxylase [Colletotrichum tofieldiae]|nr:UbiD family decarboxylase [Colletotrichum tofieldiae]GKT79781.1 ubiD family decarboxylase [Colletotrichum tofieldiae]